MFALKHVTDYCTLLSFAESYYYYLFIYLFITPEGSTTEHHHYKDSRKAQETKKLKYTKIRNNKANHTANETIDV